MPLEKLTLRRLKNRQYDESSGRRQVITPAEYAIFRGVKLARIVFNGKGWRACLLTETNNFGTAISPIGMDKFKAVKAWSFEFFKNQVYEQV